MNKLVVLIIAVFLISGCQNETNSSCAGCGAYIWTNTSQRIVINKNGGLLPQNETFDYVRDTLPNSAELKLKQIRINNTELECWNDGFTYEIVITDETGSDSEYFSNNKACNDVEGKSFVDTQEIEGLIELF